MPYWMPKWTWVSFSLRWVSQAVQPLVSFWTHASILTQRNSLNMTWSRVGSSEAFNVESAFWASMMLFVLPIIHTAKIPKILKIFKIAWQEGFVLWRPSVEPTPTRTSQRVLHNTYLVSRTTTSGFPKRKSRCPYFPNARSVTHEKSNYHRGWAIHTNCGIRVVDGATLADGVLFHDPFMEKLMSWLVPLSPPKLISLSLVPEHTPTTLLK